MIVFVERVLLGDSHYESGSGDVRPVERVTFGACECTVCAHIPHVGDSV